MSTERLETIWAIAGTIAIIAITFYKSLKSKPLDNTPQHLNKENLISHSLEVTGLQTEMLYTLISRLDSSEIYIKELDNKLKDYEAKADEMSKRVKVLELRNAELETFKNKQADEIKVLRARVKQLELELKRNDLIVPEPPDKISTEFKDEL